MAIKSRVLHGKLVSPSKWARDLKLIPHCLMSCTNISSTMEINQSKEVIETLNRAAEVEMPCSGTAMQAEKSITVKPTYSFFNRRPCIALGNFMGMTLFYITLIPRSITARPFSLTEAVEGLSIGSGYGFLNARSISAAPETASLTVTVEEGLRSETKGGINAGLSHTLC